MKNEALILKAQQGDPKAEEAFIKEYIALVKKTVASLPNLNQNHYDDLIQEGCIGLTEALRRFDVSLNIEFSTYVMYWIKKYIDMGLVKLNFQMYMPQRTMLSYSQVDKVVQRVYKETGVIPDPEEVAEITGKTLKEVLNCYYQIPKIQYYDSTAVNNNDDKTSSFLDVIASDENISKWYENTALQKDLSKILSKFNETTQRAIILKFGLFGEQEHTYEEVGETLHLTRQRVEQLFKDVKTKIRNTPYMETTLRSYL